MYHYVHKGNKVKFKKVKKIVGNDSGEIKKDKWYDIVKTKFDTHPKGFYVIDEQGKEFYISFTEHIYIKKLKGDVEID